MERTWVLGASDPEMNAIEALLVSLGESVAYATSDGRRVYPGVMYSAYEPVRHPTQIWVECAPRGELADIDHHRHGDAGFGQPPSRFMSASSLGQVISRLARSGQGLPWAKGSLPGLYPAPGFIRFDGEWVVDDNAVGAPLRIPDEIVMAAAADHCLGAAYRGECPGVDPDALLRWRVDSRSAFQGRRAEDVMTDIDMARVSLENAPDVCFGGAVFKDMRGQHVGQHVREIVEAGTRYGLSYVADGLSQPDGRTKVVASGDPIHISAWMLWASSSGIADVYGDPERGFAGGYV